MSYGNNSSAEVGVIIVMLGICLVLVLGSVTCQTTACEQVCKANGDKGEFYYFNKGCWCRDAEGLYKPEDSRAVPSTPRNP